MTFIKIYGKQIVKRFLIEKFLNHFDTYYMYQQASNKNVLTQESDWYENLVFITSVTLYFHFHFFTSKDIKLIL